MYALFNKQPRKFKKRQGKRHRSKVEQEVMFQKVDSCWLTINILIFVSMFVRIFLD